MLLFSLLAAAFLWWIGQDALEDLHPFQFYADSGTYLRTYRGETVFEGALVDVGANYLGPIAMLTLVQGNIYAVMLLNVALFTASVAAVSRLLGLNAVVLALWLLINPITVSSLLSVNKEIFLFPFLALALWAHVRRKWLPALLALLTAVLVRWQMVIFYLMLLALVGPWPLIRHRGVVMALVLLLISAAYRAIQPLIEPILHYVEGSFESYEGVGSGLFEWTLQLQNEGLYFLVFPIKAFHLLFGMGLKLEKVFFPTEIYNDLFIGGHCLVALLLALRAWQRRLLTLRHDLVAAAALFLAVFCVTPVFAPRYLYFVFMLLALALAGAPAQLRAAAALRHRAPRRAQGAAQVGAAGS
ncbi:MAG: hypothetical protein HZC37_20350 [Burkholderiales bacterium]|nr:hypothetical protein [Burkholderiales bacterium]